MGCAKRRLTGERGEVVFEQHDIDVPRSWTQLATNGRGLEVLSRSHRYAGARAERPPSHRSAYVHHRDWGKTGRISPSEATTLRSATS